MPPVDWRHRVCQDARTWENTPYQPKGRVKGVGVDCGGLLYEVYNPYFGPFKLMPDDYTADWALHSDSERYLDFIMPLVNEVGTVRPGGFSLYHMGQVYAHAAIFTEDNTYIHAFGRAREGRVAISTPRTMAALARLNGNFPIRHFDPIVN